MTSSDTSKKQEPARAFRQVTLGQPLELRANDEFFESSIDGRQAAFIRAAEQQAMAIMEQAQAQARQLLDATHEQIETLKAEADADVEQLKQAALNEIEGWKQEAEKEGYQQGYEDGQTQARQDTAEEVATILHYAQQVNQAAFEAKRQALEQFKPNILELVSYILHRIIGLQLDKDSAPFVEALLNKAADALHTTGTLRVVLNPKLYYQLKTYHELVSDGLDKLERFTFEADSDLPVDKLFVVGAEGCLEISPGTQVKRLIEPLEAYLPDIEAMAGERQASEGETENADATT
jgi:flagellar assembly protein FliH